MKRAQRTAHARLWMLLAFLIPAVFIFALAMRQTEPIDRPAVLLKAPDSQR